MTSDLVRRPHHDAPYSDQGVAVVGRALFLGTTTGLASGALGFQAAAVVDGTESGYAVLAGAIGAVLGLVVGGGLAPVVLWLAKRRPRSGDRAGVAIVGALAAAGPWLGLLSVPVTGAFVVGVGVSVAVGSGAAWWALPWVMRPVRGDHRAFPGTES